MYPPHHPIVDKVKPAKKIKTNYKNFKILFGEQIRLVCLDVRQIIYDRATVPAPEQLWLLHFQKMKQIKLISIVIIPEHSDLFRTKTVVVVFVPFVESQTVILVAILFVPAFIKCSSVICFSLDIIINITI